MEHNRKKSKVLGNSLLYTFSAVLSKAVAFLMMPIYTNFISDAQYGIVRVVNNFMTVAVYVAGVSLYSALVRFTAQYRNDPEKQKRLYGSILNFILVTTLFTMGVFMVFRDVLDRLIFEGIPFFPYVFVGLISLCFRCLAQGYTSILQGRQEGKKLVLLQAIVCLLTAGINLYLLFVMHIQGLSILLSTLIVDVLLCAVMLIDLNRRGLVRFCFDWPLLKESLRYSIPLVPHQLSSNLATLASSIILKDTQDLSTVGLYNIASNFSMIIDTIQSSVNRAFMPWFFETMDDLHTDRADEVRKSIAAFMDTILTLYGIMYVGMGLFAQEFVLLFTAKSYALSWTPVPILVCGYSIKSMYYLYLDVLLYYKDPSKKLCIATITGSLLNILLTAWFTPSMGMYGVALSFVLAKITVQFIVWWIARPYAPEIGLRVWKMFKPVALSLVVIGVGLIFSYAKYQTVLNGWNLLYKAAVFAAYLLYVIKSNPERTKAMVHMIKKKLHR